MGVYEKNDCNSYTVYLISKIQSHSKSIVVAYRTQTMTSDRVIHYIRGVSFLLAKTKRLLLNLGAHCHIYLASRLLNATREIAVDAAKCHLSSLVSLF